MAWCRTCSAKWCRELGHLPSPLWGGSTAAGGRGGGRESEHNLMTPTPNPSPQGGGEPSGVWGLKHRRPVQPEVAEQFDERLQPLAPVGLDIEPFVVEETRPGAQTGSPFRHVAHRGGFPQLRR